MKGGRPTCKQRGQSFRYHSSKSRVVDNARARVRDQRRAERERKQQQGKARGPAWMNADTEAAWTQKLSASKEYTKAKKDGASHAEINQKRDAFNAASEGFHRLASDAKQKAWDSFCEGCDPNDLTVTNKFWELAKTMKSSVNGGSPSPHQIKDEHGNLLSTDEGKGEAFLRRYMNQLQADGAEATKATWDALNDRINAASTQCQEPGVTVEEIEHALQQVSKDTAPGPDGVRYSDLKKLSAEEKLAIAQEVNRSLETGRIPTTWKDCKLTVLPKPLKDHTVLKGYRIITMSNVWVKLCEKIAAARLSGKLENGGLLPDGLGGARPRRSTTANIEAVTHSLAQGLQRGQVGAIATYDLEDAYNRVNISILAKKLEQLGSTDHMTRWIIGLLGTRRSQMRFGNWTSALFEVSSGLPQGSPLSPVLFNVYTFDIIDKLIAEQTDPFSYVDDIIVATLGNTVAKAVSRQQTASDALQQWTVDNHQSIQGEKSQWMIVTHARVNRADYTLTFNGKDVPMVEVMVCLGIAVDQKLTMAKHLDRLREKAAKALPLLKYAARQNVTQRGLTNLMRATVESRMLYGLHMASPTATTALTRLQQVQNEALRTVTGAAKPTSCASLRFWMGRPSISSQQKSRTAKEFLRALSPGTQPLRRQIEDGDDLKTPQRMKTVTSWVCTGRELIEEFCPVESIYFVNWASYKGTNLSVMKIGDRSWRDCAGECNHSLIRAWLEEEGFSTIIATDGSVRDETTAWAGSVWRENRVIFEWSTAREGRASSYRSECEAFGDALAWLEPNAMPNEKVVILTDSLSLVSRIEKGFVHVEWGERLNKIRATITVTYIPGHAGIKFNERADKLAGMAEAFGELRRTPIDVLTSLDEHLREDEFTQAALHWSTERLLERGWSYGDGNRRTERGRSKWTFNQRELGVLTRGTLRGIMEGGGPEHQPAPLLLC